MAKPVKTITYELTGTAGNDTLSFVAGNLQLNGTSKSATPDAIQITLNGGDGNDLLITDAPHSHSGTPVYYDGGRGNDTIDFSASTEAVAVHLYQGTKPGTSQPYIDTGFSWTYAADQTPYYDANDPQRWADTYTGTLTHNLLNVENVIGSAYDDYLNLGTTAGARADGGAGNDVLRGWTGPDFLNGGSGNDQLFGGAGRDTMTGGTGADQFIVLASNGLDVITDFNVSEGDHLYIGWQQNISEIANAQNWYATTWTDPTGQQHSAIEADFVGGGTILLGLTMADAAAVRASTTTFDWFA